MIIFVSLQLFCYLYLQSTDLHCVSSFHESYSFGPGDIDAALQGIDRFCGIVEDIIENGVREV